MLSACYALKSEVEAGQVLENSTSEKMFFNNKSSGRGQLYQSKLL